MISQRPDGLWDQDVYLTTSDKTLAELTKWPINPDFVDDVERHGRRHASRTGGLGDDCFVYGDFVFFGDKDFIEKIRHCLIKD